MAFRIENSNSLTDCYRIKKSFPIFPLENLEYYMATEIRKQINGATDRNLFSYSRSLGVCLLKYNKYTDNELHIGDYDSYVDCIEYFIYKKDLKYKTVWFDLMNGLCGIDDKDLHRPIILDNFYVNVSNNKMVHDYLFRMTGVGLKKRASPEKDQEILVMRPTEELIISNYIDSIYLLYSLVIRYGLPQLFIVRTIRLRLV